MAKARFLRDTLKSLNPQQATSPAIIRNTSFKKYKIGMSMQRSAWMNEVKICLNMFNNGCVEVFAEVALALPPVAEVEEEDRKKSRLRKGLERFCKVAPKAIRALRPPSDRDAAAVEALEEVDEVGSSEEETGR